MCTPAACWLPKEVHPLSLANAGFGRTEFIRRLQRHGFALFIRLRRDTVVLYRGRACRLGKYDAVDGMPLIPSHVFNRGRNPVQVHVLVSRLGNKVWYLGTSFTNPSHAVTRYKNRFRIKETFRDLKSLLGLRPAPVKGEERLARLLLGHQIACFILPVIDLDTTKRCYRHLASRPTLSTVWVSLHALSLFDKATHRKAWLRRIWPKLVLQTG